MRLLVSIDPSLLQELKEVNSVEMMKAPLMKQKKLLLTKSQETTGFKLVAIHKKYREMVENLAISEGAGAI